jgi:hypothetical protein
MTAPGPDLDTLPVEAGEDAWAAWEGRAQVGLSRRERRALARAEREALGPQPGPRGWRGPGQGEDLVLPAISEFRGPSSQLCGVWPFVVGAGAPIIGAPAGRHLITGGTVCCDEVAWYQRAHLISAPIMLVLAKLGLGKSSWVRHKLLGQYAMGILPMIFGDLRPDYVDLIRAIGGQVLTLGPGAGALNVLDPGEAHEAARRLTGALREQVLADAHTRRQVGVSSLVTIARDGQPTDREESVLDRALRVLDDNTDHRRAAPILADLLQVIRDAPDDVRAAALDRGERHRYDLIVENLEASLVALIGGGRLGDTFSRPTTEPMRRDRPVCFDVSRLRKGSTPAARAATLITCWNYGFGAIDTANALADAGLEHRRLYTATMDELWEVLRVGHGMPGRVDALARTNRANGVGITMISHSAADTRTLADPADREMARLLMEKAGVVVLGGLPEGEMPMLEQLVGLSRVEQTMLTGWTDPAAWDPVTGAETDPPGRGNFLIKVGGKPGIPVHVELTEVEKRLGVHNTARLWEHISRIGRVTDLPEGGQVRQLRRPPVPQMSAGDAG